MARKKRDKQADAEADVPAASNGYDGDQLKEYLEAIEAEHDELDKLKSAHMLACKGPRGRIKETMAAVREAEIKMPAFKAVLARRLAERKLARQVAELEDDDAHAHELMLAALGEFANTPLGRAAIARITTGADLDSLTQ
jgi:hypothetical protein